MQSPYRKVQIKAVKSFIPPEQKLWLHSNNSSPHFAFPFSSRSPSSAASFRLSFPSVWTGFFVSKLPPLYFSWPSPRRSRNYARYGRLIAKAEPVRSAYRYCGHRGRWFQVVPLDPSPFFRFTPGRYSSGRVTAFISRPVPKPSR